MMMFLIRIKIRQAIEDQETSYCTGIPHEERSVESEDGLLADIQSEP